MANALARSAKPTGNAKAPTPPGPSLAPGAGGRKAEQRAKARGKIMADPDGMNPEERAYADILEAQRLRGEIKRWDFEPVKLLITRTVEVKDGKPSARRTYYTPDFRVIMPDDTEVMREYKGFLREEALLKVRIAASVHPYTFEMVTKVKGVFQVWSFDSTGSLFQ